MAAALGLDREGSTCELWHSLWVQKHHWEFILCSIMSRFRLWISQGIPKGNFLFAWV